MVPRLDAVHDGHGLVVAHEHADGLVRLEVGAVVLSDELRIVRPLPEHELEIDSACQVVLGAEVRIPPPELVDLEAIGQAVAEVVVRPHGGHDVGATRFVGEAVRLRSAARREEQHREDRHDGAPHHRKAAAIA